jgi:hypothetical protein
MYIRLASSGGSKDWIDKFYQHHDVLDTAQEKSLCHHGKSALGCKQSRAYYFQTFTKISCSQKMKTEILICSVQSGIIDRSKVYFEVSITKVQDWYGLKFEGYFSPLKRDQDESRVGRSLKNKRPDKFIC